MYADDELGQLSEEEKKRKFRALQMQIIMLESDNRKIINEKNLLEAEMRKLKTDQERIKIELTNRKQRFDKIGFRLTQNEEDLKKMKKKLNLVR